MTTPKIQTCDVLVVGAGAAGLATAVAAAHRGLSVMVTEKEPVFGGTSARSGGWMWMPGNPLASREGIKDSAEQARLYIEHEAGDKFDARRVDAFLDAVPRAVEFFEQETALQFDLGPTFADYHPDAAGGMPGGRSIVAKPFDGRELGKEISRLRPPLREITMLGMMIGTGKELPHFFNFMRSPVSAYFVGKIVLRFLWDLVLYRRPMRLVNGNALVARLAKSCIDLNIPILTRSPVIELLRDEKNNVTGAIIDTPAGRTEIRTRKGVMLAAGGFSQDVVRRKELFAHAPNGYEHVTPAAPGSTGDGLRLAENAGGTVDDTLPQAAAWVPISRPLRSDGTLGTFPHFVDRSKPGVIAVTRSGRRFVNEANSYHDFCQAMLARCTEEQSEICAFFITDHRAFRKYGLGFAKPSPIPYKHLVKSGYLFTGKSLAELAGQIGVDAGELNETVTAFNRFAAKGEDPEFHKGSTAYNRSLGDPNQKPNPCVAPIERGPFYAVKLMIGDLGTFAGLRCDEYARVLDRTGRPIGGLYAAGNDAVSIMGGNYPGGGTTLGPALAFGYIAATHMAGANH
ncbi:FAD-dependent oxidoreductase [Mesorhizobium sp. B2-4-9]|uniref:FAD-dependent oxidoreductase n=1 Tax=Mesorhizobium sp. B2-4-9 TaxID=2589940 RepID=UPI00112B9BF9|nr:FAD-dependent oxidoreductase [Mesorhizobium sp. B2-4-9]TPL21071.1 FAD-dependent oxidoreductase [Mesorhizobium sp. B2-4-9]